MRMRKGAEKAKRRPHTVDTVIACGLFVIHPSIFTIDKIFHYHGAHQTLSWNYNQRLYFCIFILVIIVLVMDDNHHIDGSNLHLIETEKASVWKYSSSLSTPSSISYQQHFLLYATDLDLVETEKAEHGVEYEQPALCLVLQFDNSLVISHNSF